MADFAVVEYPPVTVVAVEDDEDQLNLTSLTSVRYMRPFGCVVLVSLLLVYTFLISNATRRRKKRMENPVEKVKELPPSFPCEIRVRRVQQDLGIEVALMDAPSPKPSRAWTLPIKNRSAWINKQHSTADTASPGISPASSGSLTRSTLVLESDSWSTPQNHCGSLLEALSDCGSASAPSDEGMMILPQKYLPEPPQTPAPPVHGLLARHMSSSPITTPRKQAILFPPPMRHNNTLHPLPSSSPTPARCFPTGTSRKPTETPSDEEDEDECPLSDLKIKAQWTSDADAAAIQELISENV